MLVRGGTVVTASGRRRADVRVRGETIVEVGPDLPPDGERVIDAGGLVVLPGGVDPHTHLTAPPGVPEALRRADDLASGSAAAVAGGITTIGTMTFPADREGLTAAVAREADEARRLAIADVILHPVLLLPTSERLREIAALADAGHTSLKIFTSVAEFDRYAPAFVGAMLACAEAGTLVLVHCEDHALVTLATQALAAERAAGVARYAESRPVVAEVVATQRAAALAEATGAATYVVHLSSARALAVCEEARGRGVPVYVETRPVYLALTEERYAGPDGALYVAQPPLRRAEDVAALWDGLARGAIDALGSDHVGWSRAQKLAGATEPDATRPGLPDLETMLPLVFSEGVASGRLTAERFVALSSTNPARLLGLYPRKGAIEPGADADLALWDPEERRVVEAGRLVTRAGYSPYEGLRLTGWPRHVLRRGELVVEDGRVVGRPGTGQVPARARVGAIALA